MNVDWTLTNFHMSLDSGDSGQHSRCSIFHSGTWFFCFNRSLKQMLPSLAWWLPNGWKKISTNSSWTQVIKVLPSCSGWGWRQNWFGEPDYKRHHLEPQLLHEWCLFICGDLGFQTVSLTLMQSATSCPGWLGLTWVKHCHSQHY